MALKTGAPSDKDVKYDTETVKVIRGTEEKTISKREGDGWELVSQNPGKLRSELVFRRPSSKTPWRVLAIIGGVLVVLFIFIGIMATFSNDDGDVEPAPVKTPSAQAVAPSSEPLADSEESAPVEEESATEVSDGVSTTVDELLDKLNSAEMGGIKTGDRFTLTGELFMSDLWMTGATGDYFVMLKAQGGAQDLTVFVDEAVASGWTDGTMVEMTLEAVDAIIDGETSSGWLRAVSTKTIR
ncbi:hypothetical protein [Microbacterium galbinum]|uniref:DUF4115 domain-containing protein n=1 Tax=Microbacterium galbinum TaxID=2851646 RepID=A0ABY4ISD9_9MICO|nr:hypothetical protein [Microbacterium galbinum]UPL15705.1 hypothetical protein KV396_14985 [Microbacterium galbinum]